ncbi:hypothetical protein BTO02_23245 [Paraburkholderia sp. SOS3]|nr:hypothetical protein BTO02_23245 [Paraburkholderia sp. SOS3]
MPIGIDLMRVISIEKVSKGTDALEIYFFRAIVCATAFYLNQYRRSRVRNNFMPLYLLQGATFF